MLGQDNPLRGLFVKLRSTEVIDLIADQGLDFAVVDLEHSQLTEADALALVRHAHARGLPALVRIPEVDRGAVNRLLEAGARGIQLSTVRRVDQILALRKAMAYAPDGTRSISLAHPLAGFGATALPAYLAAQREQPAWLVAQIETATTDDPLDDVVAAGIDVAFVGTTDLLVDVSLDRAALAARVEEIADAADRAGVTLGAFGVDDPRVTFDIAGSDVSLLRAAVGDVARSAAHA
jgi:4-hydroxy-2-oxoheptanedioate aldolase